MGFLGGLFGGGGSGYRLAGAPTHPTRMLMAGGGTIQASTPTLVGERGPELFVPNTGGTVMNAMNTRSAVGSGKSTNITQNFNVTTGVQQTVRAEIMNMMPVIERQMLNAVINERQRGGAFANGLFG